MTIRALVALCAVVLAACTAAGTASPAATATSATTDSAGAADSSPVPGATPTAPGVLEPSEGFAVADVVFTDGERRVQVPVLVADTAELRTTGLMGRTDLPADAGMLFAFEDPTTGAFWMKDTLLPLSIAFVGQDGTVQQLIDMEPCTADPCPRYAPDDPYLYAVEVNQGFFSRQRITPGWRLDVDDALGGA